ncbi:MAG TPA: FG-GAP-like repeat-containing protein, partial [Dyadobacter sp.]|nr:FG-GAP-like repeat-containing protein [Dyadobacter sp.]
MRRFLPPISYFRCIVFIVGFLFFYAVNLDVQRRPALSKLSAPDGNENELIQSRAEPFVDLALQKAEQMEYSISFDPNKEMLQSPNRAHNLRAYYKPGRLIVNNRVNSSLPQLAFELINEGIYADRKLLFVPNRKATNKLSENRLTINHNGFKEEYVNNADGIRQNFIIEDAPAETSQLTVRLEAKGLLIENHTREAIYFRSNGQTTNRIIYDGLKCWDANRKPLAAYLAVKDSKIEINVDVRDASYPVTIDPILTNGSYFKEDKRIEINQYGAILGFSVSSAGDVNGDGYSDVLVGAPMYDWNGQDAGAAFVFPGTAHGLSLAGIRLAVNQAGAKAGYSVNTAGDVNGDGYSDVVVGAPFYDNGQTDEGAAFVYYGSPSGIQTKASVILEGNQASAGFGISVSMAGSINGDQYSDVVVGAHLFDSGEKDEGAAFVYYGSASGLSASNSIRLEGNQANARMGFSVAGAGDLEEDGFGDLIVGAYLFDDGELDEGVAFLYRGSAVGLNTSAVKIQNNQAGAHMGYSVACAGDLNGNGRSGIVIGAPEFDKGEIDEGVVFWYDKGFTTPFATIEINQAGAGFGTAVACAGDINGDNFSDLIVGAARYSNGQQNEGAAFLYTGHFGLSFSYPPLNMQPAAIMEANQAGGLLGTSVASAGDVNGDGYSDIVIGAPEYGNGQLKEGHVLIYHGKDVGMSASTLLGTGSSGALAGFSVAGPGDIDGNTYEEIAVGYPNYDRGYGQEGMVRMYYSYDQGIEPNLSTALTLPASTTPRNWHLGRSLSPVGSPTDWDRFVGGLSGYSTSLNNMGAVFTFSGGQPYWGATISLIREGTQADSQLGYSVAGAGDVNGDGYTDFVAGAPFHISSGIKSGVVFLYYGNSTNMAGVIQVPELQKDSQTGGSVGGAGDVNGDGYSDILVGASQFDEGNLIDAGRVYLYYGTASGLNPVPKVIKGTQAGAKLGSSVSGAGDINGDGFSDIIIGSPESDRGEVNEGSAVIYYGSSSGITDQGFRTLELNNTEGVFGCAVASAGDVDGDGYADVVVGVKGYSRQFTRQGAAAIYRGAADGIIPYPWKVIEGPQAECAFGSAVAGTGDNNSDGFSDIVIGAPLYDVDGGTDNGAAWLYHGNSMGPSY